MHFNKDFNIWPFQEPHLSLDFSNGLAFNICYGTLMLWLWTLNSLGESCYMTVTSVDKNLTFLGFSGIPELEFCGERNWFGALVQIVKCKRQSAIRNVMQYS